MSKVTWEEVSNALKEKFGSQIIAETFEYDFPVITIKKESIAAVVKFLYEDANFQFQYLTTMCGLHYPDSPQPFGMMYQLHSLVNNLRIRFKAFTSKEDLEYDTQIGRAHV